MGDAADRAYAAPWPGVISVDADPELVERADELTALAGALDAIVESGAVCTVEGVPGAGKSRLLKWARKRAKARGYGVLATRADEVERHVPFSAVRGVFEPALRALPRGEREQFLEVAPILARPLSVDARGRVAAHMRDPGYAELCGLYWALAGFCRTRPQLLIVDDAQWADSHSLHFLRFLAKNVAQLPLVAVIATRSDEPQGISQVLGELLRGPDTMRLRLTPLSPGPTAELVRARLDADGSQELCAECDRMTGGNPFFLVSLLDELARRGAPDDIGEIRRLVPESVSQAILVRIARLAPAAGLLAAAAAVLGDGAQLRDAAALAGIDGPVTAIARALVRSDILRPVADIRFAYPIVREAIYQNLTPRARSEAHGRAASLLAARAEPTERVASHLLQTEPVGERWIVARLRHTALQAAQLGNGDRAAEYLRRVLRERLPPPERTEMLQLLAEAEAPNHLPAAIEHATELVTLADSLDAWDTRVQATRLLVILLLRAGRRTEALSAVDRLIATMRAEGKREQQLELEADLAAILMSQPHHHLGFGARLDRLEPELAGDSIAERRVLAMLAYRKAQLLAPADRAAELAERALAGGCLLAAGVESIPLFAAGTVLGLAERSHATEQLFGQIATRARLADAPLAYSAALLQRGVQRFGRGALYEALADVRTALEVARARRLEGAARASLAALVRILIERGDLDECERELDAPGVTAVLSGGHAREGVADLAGRHRLLVVRGRVRIAQNRLPEGLADLLEAGRHETGGPVMSDWRVHAAMAYLQSGEDSRALELARAEHDIATAWGARRRLGLATSTLGWVEGGEQGIGRIRAAVRLLEQSDARLEHARAQVRLGAVLRRAGRPSDARSFLRSGLELATRCGAWTIADLGQQELAATGMRRRRDATRSGSEALTPSERRIADLAAGGLANPEIAQSLVISRRTVEMHLRSIYRKLGIDSRGRLGAALECGDR